MYGFDSIKETWIGRREVQCNEEQYVSIINDGGIEVDELVDIVTSHLGLGNWYGKKEKRAYCIWPNVETPKEYSLFDG